MRLIEKTFQQNFERFGPSGIEHPDRLQLEPAEFAVLAPESSGDPPELLVHRVKGAVKDFDSSSPEPYRLSVSVGVARFDGDALVRLDDLLAEADSAMYEEKRAKRRVVSG